MTKTIDITPDVTLLKKAGEVNYKIPQALAELADNPIDERIPGEKLTVEITTGKKDGKSRIVVADDAAGMTADKAAKALVMAHSTKGHGAIGEFGLGLKTSCSFLGSRFSILTCTADAEKAIELIYDEDEFIRKGKWSIEMHEVPKTFDHGTRIEIEDLKVNLYAGVKDIVLAKFAKTFKHFVAAGDVEILVNGDAVVPHIADTIKDYDTELDFLVEGKLCAVGSASPPEVPARGSTASTSSGITGSSRSTKRSDSRAAPVQRGLSASSTSMTFL